MGRRECKRHAKSWRGEKEESFLPFYFRLRAFSIQRAQLSRILEQARFRGICGASHVLFKENKISERFEGFTCNEKKERENARAGYRMNEKCK